MSLSLFIFLLSLFTLSSFSYLSVSLFTSSVSLLLSTFHSLSSKTTLHSSDLKTRSPPPLQPNLRRMYYGFRSWNSTIKTLDLEFSWPNLTSKSSKSWVILRIKWVLIYFCVCFCRIFGWFLSKIWIDFGRYFGWFFGLNLVVDFGYNFLEFQGLIFCFLVECLGLIFSN